MKAAFEALGLAADADELAVKRAYARRLKDVRPDADPAGFQRLHEAYRAALEACRQRPASANSAAAPPTAAADWARPDVRITIEGLGGASIPPKVPTPSPFDFEAFRQRCFELGRSAPDALPAWLQSIQDLWALQLKQRVGLQLMQALERELPPMAPAAFNTVLRFFELDHVGAQRDPYAVQRMRERMELAWLLEPANIRHLAARVRDPGKGLEVERTRRLLHRVSAPFRRPAAWMQALVPGWPNQTGAFLRRLDRGDLRQLPPPIDPQQVAFWARASDPARLTRERLALGAWRAALVALLLFGLSAWLDIPASGQADSLSRLQVGVRCLGMSLAGWAAWLAVFHGGRKLLAWQGAPELPLVPWPRLRLAFVPLLCAAGLVALYVLQSVPTAIAITILTLYVALCRYWRRNGTAIRVPIIAIYLFMAMVAFPPLGLSTALCLWSWDLWKQRARLRLRIT